MADYRIHHGGDTSIIVEFGRTIDARLSRRVLALDAVVDALSLEGIVETIPSFRSLMIVYDPLTLTCEALTGRIAGLLDETVERVVEPRLVRLPVCYDPRAGVDLVAFAERVGLSPAAVAERHCAPTYDVFMLGFLPGQPYLGEIDAALRAPRRETPRTSIPAGSVGVATSLTSVFPRATPCGWHLIARTPTPMWSDGAALLAPGDRVKFEPISYAAYEDMRSSLLAGRSEERAA